MCQQPGGEGLFGDIASGNSEHGDHTRCIVGGEAPAIEPQKQFGRHIARSLVSINKRMVARNSIAIRGCQRGCIRRRLAIVVQLLRLVQGRIQQTRIADACPAPMFGQLHFVDGNDDGSVQPDPFAHLASSCSTARRSFMISRATRICASNSGLWVVIRKPSGDSVTYSSSPFSSCNRASSSFGKIAPTELPTWVSLRVCMGNLRVITNVILDFLPPRVKPPRPLPALSSPPTPPPTPHRIQALCALEARGAHAAPRWHQPPHYPSPLPSPPPLPPPVRGRPGRAACGRLRGRRPAERRWVPRCGFQPARARGPAPAPGAAAWVPSARRP